MLKLKNVNKGYSGFKLKDISFELPQGYIMGLVGRNGAGKSTLLRLVMGLIKADSGSIEFMGKDIVDNEKWAKDNMGFVLAEKVFDDYNTLEANAKMYGAFYSRYNHKSFLDYCQRFELDPSRKLKNNSRGERMKFQYAFALAHDPRLLILDEPVGSFDPDFQKEFYKSLTDYIATGENSVILATHITSEMDKRADYITLIDAGRLIFSKDKESLTEEFKLVTAEDYKINLIPVDKVIGREKEIHYTKALIRPTHEVTTDKDYTINTPSIEEIMYYIAKGDYKGE